MLGFYFRVSKAIRGVVIDHPDRLHVGVADGGAEEFESTLFEVLCPNLRLRGDRGKVLKALPFSIPRLPVHKTPHIFREISKFLLNLKKPLRVVDGRLYFLSVADDGGIFKEPGDVPLGESRHFFRIESGKGISISLPLP